jgi:uncharacterized membrane protein YccC
LIDRALGLIAPGRERARRLAHAVRLALIGGVAVWVGHVVDPARGAWLVSSAVLIAKPSLDATLTTGLQRAAATLIGALGAAALLTLTSDQVVLLLAATATITVAMAVMPMSYALGMLTVTPLSIVLTDLLAPGSWEIAAGRRRDSRLDCDA